jgi:hypothetical protein
MRQIPGLATRGLAMRGLVTLLAEKGLCTLVGVCWANAAGLLLKPGENGLLCRLCRRCRVANGLAIGPLTRIDMINQPPVSHIPCSPARRSPFSPFCLCRKRHPLVSLSWLGRGPPSPGLLAALWGKRLSHCGPFWLSGLASRAGPLSVPPLPTGPSGLASQGGSWGPRSPAPVRHILHTGLGGCSCSLQATGAGRPVQRARKARLRGAPCALRSHTHTTH